MINHSNCDHPSTSSARAKCRRQQAGGESTPKKARSGATAQEIDFSKAESKKAQTPRDKDKQCDNCGVERVAYRGLDVLTGVTLYVGERCYYMVKRDPDGAVPLD